MLTIGQTEYQPTAQVLDHFHHEINEVLGGIDDGTGKKVPAKIALLGGADLVETFVQPGVWSPVDLHHILVDCTCTIKKQSNEPTNHIFSRRIHH
jgi:nicotinic acid mononucleotide adenylyltransferase